jgi:hypothetical protein
MNKITEHFLIDSQPIFTLSDASIVVAGTEYSLHGLIKRAINDQDILHLRRGLYCLAPKYQKNPISIYQLAQRIYGPSYISRESALSYHGWIPESVQICTNTSYGNAKYFKNPMGHFCYKRVPQISFYQSVEYVKSENGVVFLMASPVKALMDFLYLLRWKSTNIKEIMASLRIEMEDWSSVTKDELISLKKSYSNRRVKQVLENWIRELEK